MVMDVYEFARGPLAWICLLIFFFGSLYRVGYLFFSGKSEPALNKSRRNKDVARSILHGITPFYARIMRRLPLLTAVTFLFHVCVVLVPLFCLAHTVLWYESWGIQWASLPDTLADAMTLFVIAACIYFLVRRATLQAVKNVSQPSDWVFPGVILITFLAGFLASHQWGPYRPMLILHVISSELLIAMLPFSKLGHMLSFWFSRAYMGAEFGKHMQTGDW